MNYKYRIREKKVVKGELTVMAHYFPEWKIPFLPFWKSFRTKRLVGNVVINERVWYESFYLAKGFLENDNKYRVVSKYWHLN